MAFRVAEQQKHVTRFWRFWKITKQGLANVVAWTDKLDINLYLFQITDNVAFGVMIGNRKDESVSESEE